MFKILGPIIVLTAAFAGGCSLFTEEFTAPTEVRTVTPAESEIGEPFGIAAKDGVLFVSDGLKGVIWKIAEDGRPGIFASGFSTPSHLDFDSKGNLYVADSGAHAIKKVLTDGTVETVAGIPGKSGYRNGPAAQALFNGPVGIAAVEDSVFVGDTYNDRIREISGGEVRTLSGGGQGFAEGLNGRFDTPTGVAAFGDSIIVADTGNRRIRIVNKDGSVATLAGSGAFDSDGTLGGAGFSSPLDLTVDRNGTIIVADGNKVKYIEQRIIPIVRTISGDGRGLSDGALVRARFNRVSGLCAMDNGDVFAADSDNGLIRVLTGNETGETRGRSRFGEKEAITRFRADGPARWPYQPPRRTREIAGTLGEIRGEIDGPNSQAWFHNGLDITGALGEKAYIIRDEKILRPVAVGEFGTKRENVRFPKLGYVHVRLGRDSTGRTLKDDRFRFRFEGGRPVGLRLRRGTVFRSGEVIGTVNTMYHVHLIAGPPGGEYNALAALKLPGASDSRIPTIEEVELFDYDWKTSETASGEFRIRVGSKQRLIVTAFDQMDGNAARRRLGLFKLGYQILGVDGTPIKDHRNPKWTISFERTPSDEAVSLVYAEGSHSGATGKTVFKYIVTNTVDGNRYEEGFLDVPDKAGTYIVRTFAADYFGNIASKDTRVTVE